MRSSLVQTRTIGPSRWYDHGVAVRALLVLVAWSTTGCSFQVDGISSGALADDSKDLSGVPEMSTVDGSESGDDGPSDAQAAVDQAQLPLDLPPPPLDLTSRPDLLSTFCGEPNLLACFEFEDGANATIAHDGTANHDDLTLTSCSELGTGHAGGGLSVGAGSLAHANHNAAIDTAQITIEMWIKPTSLPATIGSRAGLQDEDGAYGLFIYNPGVLTCSLAGITVSSNQNEVVTGAWQHVACTYDQQKVRVYYNGNEIASQNNTASVGGATTAGLCVGMNSPNGDNFVGLIDEVRIFSAARTAAQICAAAGAPGC